MVAGKKMNRDAVVGEFAYFAKENGLNPPWHNMPVLEPEIKNIAQ